MMRFRLIAISCRSVKLYRPVGLTESEAIKEAIKSSLKEHEYSEQPSIEQPGPTAPADSSDDLIIH